MKQDAFPFHETAEDATNTAIIRSGKQHKEVAMACWPRMKPDSAYAKLKNGLRPDTREHLTSDDHLFIANYCQQYDWLYYNALRCNHSQPEPVAPKDALEEKLDRYLALTQQADALRKAIDADIPKLRAAG